MHHLTRFEEVIISEREVEIRYRSQAKVRITSPQIGMFHFQFLRCTEWMEEVPEPTFSVLPKELLPLQVEEEDEEILIVTSKGKAIITKQPFAIRFADEKDRVVASSHQHISYRFDGWKVRAGFNIGENERFYGLGESDIIQDEIPLDHRGTVLPIWNKHQPAPARLMIPVVYSSAGYGVYFDNPWAARFDFGVESAESWFYEAEGGIMEYYFFFGETLAALVDQYTMLTGRPEIPPLWSFGYLQSKFGYRTQEEVLELAQTFRKKGIPCDSIILDLYWFKRMGDLAFDREAFPNPEEMIRSLREMGFHVIVIEEPYLLTDSRLFAEADRLKLLAKRTDGTSYILPFFPGISALVDFTDPLAKQWWADQHIPLMKMGIEGWWTDLNEPEAHYPDMVHHAGPAQKVHNPFSLEMHKSLALAYQQHQPEKRLFIMSRSAWAGSQRFGVGVWSGDVECSWDHLRKQISLGINMGLAGIGLWNTDIGGFWGEMPSAELFLRWIQFGAFTPIMRPHGAHQPREPWIYGEEIEKEIKRYIECRYRLLPYFYAMAYEANQTGIPYMRPIFMYHPDEADSFEITDQYYLGKFLHVAPVLEEGATTRKVYLPKGRWYDFWTGDKIAGGAWFTVAAPLNALPLFVREGAIIPMVPAVQHAEEKAWEKLTLQIYSGEAEQFLLYEDDGRTTAYKKGYYRTTLIRHWLEDKTWKIVIGAGAGEFPNMAVEREIDLKLYHDGGFAKITISGMGAEAKYQDNHTLISLGKRSCMEEIQIEAEFN